MAAMTTFDTSASSRRPTKPSALKSNAVSDRFITIWSYTSL